MHLPAPKRLLAQGLLALVFLFAQQHAALHWLSHAIAATRAKAAGGSGVPDHCSECLALGALGGAAPASASALPAGVAHHALVALPPVANSTAALRFAFHSRAPPTLI